MKLENFKGIRDFELDFGQVTEIRGRNATGKTTIADAFTWCLFGKDSSGRTAFNIKTIGEDGVIEKIDHSVEVVLSVVNNDGVVKETSLKRILREDWVKPRGKAEPELKGNSTHYYVDDMEEKATTFSATVSTIIEEDVFRLVTSPTYFPTMDWKKQREMLIGMAGKVSYEDVAFDKELKDLLVAMNKDDMATFKTRIANKKKPIKEELDDCPTRISAIHSVTPEEKDFAKIEAEIAELKAEYDGNLQLIRDKAAAYNAKYEAIQAKQQHINDLRMQQMKVVSAAEQNEQARVITANAEYNKMKMELDSLLREAQTMKQRTTNELQSMDADIAANKDRAALLDKECVEMRAKWSEVNGRTFEDNEKEVVCPLLNTVCKDPNIVANTNEHRANARKAFNEKKAEELASITTSGKAKMEEKARIENYVQNLVDKRASRSIEIAEKEIKLDDDIKKLKAELANCTPAEKRAIDPKEISEWVMLEETIISEQSAIQQPENEDDSALVERGDVLQKQIDDLKKVLADKDTIAKNKAKMAEIKEREKELAQQLADLEKQEYNAERLEKAYITEVENRVNKMFELVKFRMFDKQINGGEAPTCVAMVDNVPYSDLNNAMKINAGVDVLNTLQRCMQISAPLFVDNAEAVNQVWHTDSQLILLLVTNDEKLNITIK